MKKVSFIVCLFLFTTIHADILKPNYTFSNVSLNYLNWTNGTSERASKKDFSYLELEGGAGWDWGDFYMFIDIENPRKSYNDTPADNMRFVFKPVLDIKIVDNFNIYLQDYNLKSKDFYISNLIVGLSYKIETDFGLWIKPFIGLHYQASTYYTGMNGYMFGWALDYQFEIQKNKFSISQWHENTFNRDNENGYDNHIGTQGALSFWWHPLKEITTGIQYRYAYYELGSQEYQAGFIYSLKYNF